MLSFCGLERQRVSAGVVLLLTNVAKYFKFSLFFLKKKKQKLKKNKKRRSAGAHGPLAGPQAGQGLGWFANFF